MFKKIGLKSLIALAGISTLVLPFILSNCSDVEVSDDVEVYPKAKMEAAFKDVENYLKENSTPTASGDVDFSSLPKYDHNSPLHYSNSALDYLNTNYTIEHFYRSIIFFYFYVSLYPFSSAERLEQYNNFFIKNDVTKVSEFSFSTTANSFEINMAFAHVRTGKHGEIINVRESIYCLTRLENNKLYEKSTYSAYTTDDNILVSEDEYDTEITKNDGKFFYINHTPEEYWQDEKDGLDIIFNYIPPSYSSYTQFPELSRREFGIGTVTVDDHNNYGASERYYVYLSPFDWTNLKMPDFVYDESSYN